MAARVPNTPGYPPSGISQFSRANASRSPDWTPRDTPRKRGRPRALILKTQEEVATLRKELRTASGTERDRITKALMIKVRFLSRLHAEVAKGATDEN